PVRRRTMAPKPTRRPRPPSETTRSAPFRIASANARPLNPRIGRRIRASRARPGMVCRRSGGALAQAACLALLFVLGCSAGRGAPGRTPGRASGSPAVKPVAPAETPETEPAVCSYDDHYEDESYFVSLEAAEPQHGSR